MNDFQNLKVKSLSLSDMIFSGNSYCATTFLINAYTSSLASLLFLYNANILYLVVLSIITQITLYITFVIGSFDCGSLIIKSNTIDFYTPAGVGGGCNSPYGTCLFILLLLYKSHFIITSFTTFFSPEK